MVYSEIPQSYIDDIEIPRDFGQKTRDNFNALPRGMVDYTTVETDVPGIDGIQMYIYSTFTAEANRYYSITASLGFTGSTGAAFGITCYWALGSTASADNQVGSGVQYAHATTGATQRTSGVWVAEGVIPAGVVTLGVALRTFGPGTTATEAQMKITDEGGV